MDSQPSKVLSEELERQRVKLIQVVEKLQLVDTLRMAPEWPVFMDWLKKSDERMQKQILEGKFVNDHNGYIYSVAARDTLDMIFKGLDRFEKTYKQANKKLQQINDIEKEAKNG